MTNCLFVSTLSREGTWQWCLLQEHLRNALFFVAPDGVLDSCQSAPEANSQQLSLFVGTIFKSAPEALLKSSRNAPEAMVHRQSPILCAPRYRSLQQRAEPLKKDPQPTRKIQTYGPLWFLCSGKFPRKLLGRFFRIFLS